MAFVLGSGLVNVSGDCVADGVKDHFNLIHVWATTEEIEIKGHNERGVKGNIYDGCF